jgi:hypothetical protein
MAVYALSLQKPLATRDIRMACARHKAAIMLVAAELNARGLVPSQVHRWKKTDVQFRDQYERALAFRTDLQLDEIAEIADNCRPGMVRKAKLQIDARKWIVSRMMPKLARGQG